MRHIESYTHHNRIAVLVELETSDAITLHCDEFQNLAKQIAMHIAATNPAGIDSSSMEHIVPIHFRGSNIGLSEEALLDQAWIKDPSIKVRELIEHVTGELKTPIRVTRFCRFDIDDR